MWACGGGPIDHLTHVRAWRLNRCPFFVRAERPLPIKDRNLGTVKLKSVGRDFSDSGPLKLFEVDSFCRFGLLRYCYGPDSHIQCRGRRTPRTIFGGFVAAS
jgi:hypothetical protein